MTLHQRSLTLTPLQTLLHAYVSMCLVVHLYVHKLALRMQMHSVWFLATDALPSFTTEKQRTETLLIFIGLNVKSM